MLSDDKLKLFIESESTTRESKKAEYKLSGIDPLLVEIAFDYAAPVLVSYCNWLLQQFKSLGFDRVYFLARDGRVLWEIAKIFAHEFNETFDFRYLHASRQSWILPSLKNFNDLAENEVFFRLAKGLTLRRLLYRFKIERLIGSKILEKKLADYHLELDKELSPLKIAKAKKFFSDEVILSEIERQSKKEYELLIAYLDQEGIFNSGNFAIVDIGWRGSLAKALVNLFEKAVGSKPNAHFFFFDLFSEIDVINENRVHAFLKEENLRHSRKLRGAMEILMEIFCAIPVPGAAGFKRKNEKIVPKLMAEDMTPMRDWGILTFRRMVLDYANWFADFARKEEINWQDHYKSAMDRFYHFLAFPTREEAERLSSFPYFAKQVYLEGDKFAGICRPFSMKDFAKILINQNPYLPDVFWIQGSLAMTKNRMTRFLFSLFYKIIHSYPVQLIEGWLRN